MPRAAAPGASPKIEFQAWDRGWVGAQRFGRATGLSSVIDTQALVYGRQFLRWALTRPWPVTAPLTQAATHTGSESLSAMYVAMHGGLH